MSNKPAAFAIAIPLAAIAMGAVKNIMRRNCTLVQQRINEWLLDGLEPAEKQAFADTLAKIL